MRERICVSDAFIMASAGNPPRILALRRPADRLRCCLRADGILSEDW